MHNNNNGVAAVYLFGSVENVGPPLAIDSVVDT